MELIDLITRNRSYRRFDGTHTINTETLKDLINLARLSPSAQNLQPLRYVLSNDNDQTHHVPKRSLDDLIL